MTQNENKYFLRAVLAAIAVVACAGIAHAQGSRKDDVVFNAQGRPMAGATVRVCTSSATGQPCSPLALIYSDAALTQALANPLSADGLGNYTFYAAPGRYEIEISGPGITTKQLPNVILPSDPSTPTFTTVTTTSGISAFSLSLTGNLTVSGSTAVAGTLTVGGAPVPSTNADNQWTSAQRFKGPLPWRDFTAYMPAGGCSAVSGRSDPATTGSISSGSYTLTLSNAIDFQNGCGITVLHAGPTSSLVIASGCSATALRSGNVATLTCSGNHYLAVGSGGYDQSVIVSGCSDSSFNTTSSLITGVADTTHLTYSNTGSNVTTSVTGCAVSFLNGWAHGVTGSTTYYYKIAGCDTNAGCSAAVGPVTITNGNATLTAENYNWLGWPYLGNATGSGRLACVYRSTNGTTYTAIGTALDEGFTDRGLPFPVFPSCPSTPPSSPTAQQLTTTIASGAGTTTLTLAAAASNSASSQNVYHDETSFLLSCINDVQNDQSHPAHSGGWAYGSHGCLIPAGNWNFNSDTVTDTVQPASGTAIYVDGTITLMTWPWIFGYNSNGWLMQGMGSSGGSVAPNQDFPTTQMVMGANVAAGFAVDGQNIAIHNFSTGGYGDGLRMMHGCCLDIENLVLSSSGNTAGVPLIFDINSLFVTAHRIVLHPNSAGIPASILFTTSTYDGNGWCCMEFSNIFSLWHGALFEYPGGSSTGQGSPISFNHWEFEDRGQYPTGGIITVDTGNGNPPGTSGTSPVIPRLRLTQVDNADATNNNLLYYKGSGAAGSVNINLYQSYAYNPLVACAQGATCFNGTGQPPVITSDQPQPQTGDLGQYVGQGPYGGAYYTGGPLMITGGPGDYGNSPAWLSLADALPPPHSLGVVSTGSGSLAAGQYCMRVVGVGSNPTTPWQTLPSPETCQTVGASSSIVLQWYVPAITGSGNLYADYYLYFGSTPGGENQYIDTSIAPSDTYNPTYTFTSTSGATGASPPNTPGAAVSWLYREPGTKSCLLCSAGSARIMQLGIGEPNAPSGDKVAVKGGYLDAEGGLRLNGALLESTTAPTISSGFGTSPAITYSNGTASFEITVGSGGSASTGVITLPAAPHGWSCRLDDQTTQSTSVARTMQTANTTTSATFTQYSDVMVATAWAAADVLVGGCRPF